MIVWGAVSGDCLSPLYFNGYHSNSNDNVIIWKTFYIMISQFAQKLKIMLTSKMKARECTVTILFFILQKRNNYKY
jgi:hypothetical protein